MTWEQEQYLKMRQEQEIEREKMRRTQPPRDYSTMNPNEMMFIPESPQARPEFWKQYGWSFDPTTSQYVRQQQIQSISRAGWFKKYRPDLYNPDDMYSADMVEDSPTAPRTPGDPSRGTSDQYLEIRRQQQQQQRIDYPRLPSPTLSSAPALGFLPGWGDQSQGAPTMPWMTPQPVRMPSASYSNQPFKPYVPHVPQQRQNYAWPYAPEKTAPRFRKRDWQPLERKLV